jgi:hypothetical protein
MKMAAHRAPKSGRKQAAQGFMSYRLSAIGYIGYQLSVISYWLVAGLGPPP